MNVDILSENELKISNNEILLIKRVAIDISKSGLQHQKLKIQFNIPLKNFTVTSKKTKLKSIRISQNEIEVELPNLGPSSRIFGFIIKALIEPDSYKLGGLRVVEWPSLDLYKVTSIRKPYQILGFKNVIKEPLEDYWTATESVTEKVTSHIARKRSARIELNEKGLPIYKFRSILSIDCRKGSNIEEIIVNMPQTNQRQKTIVNSKTSYNIMKDNNGNSRIVIKYPCQPGECKELTFEFEVQLLEIKPYQEQFGDPKKEFYIPLFIPKNQFLFSGNEYWNIEDTDIKQVSNATNKMKNVWNIHRFLFEFVNRRIKYMANGIRYTSKEAFHNKDGDCSEFADLLITLHRLSGIPSRLKEGVIALPSNGNITVEGHAWVEFLVPSGWIPCDPTWGIPIGITSQHIDFQTHLTDPPPPALKYASSGPSPDVSWVHTIIEIR